MISSVFNDILTFGDLEKSLTLDGLLLLLYWILYELIVLIFRDDFIFVKWLGGIGRCIISLNSSPIELLPPYLDLLDFTMKL